MLISFKASFQNYMYNNKASLSLPGKRMVY